MLGEDRKFTRTHTASTIRRERVNLKGSGFGDWGRRERERSLEFGAMARQLKLASVRGICHVLDPSGEHRIPHGACAGRRQRLASSVQLHHFLMDQPAQNPLGRFFRGAVADAAPGKQIRAITHVGAILVAPEHEFQMPIFCFHRLTSRTALRLKRRRFPGAGLRGRYGG